MKRRTVYFTAPGRVELREEPLPVPGADDVLVETLCSAISAGTEMLLYRGEFPSLHDSHDPLTSDLTYPIAFGYSCVGIIRDTGSNVDQGLKDKMVFGFHPHTTHFTATPTSLIFAPASLPAEVCVFLPNMETAVNLVHDGAPILGERALVIGQGVIGLLVASLLSEFPLETLVTSDCYELRRSASRAIGVNESVDPVAVHDMTHANLSVKTSREHQHLHLPGYAQDNFDLTFELSGSPAALNAAIAMTAFSGRVVIGSWYGEKRALIDLGGAFHRSRIKLISSQVSTIAPGLSGRWDKARRFEVASEALKRIQPQKWITHRFPIDQAEKAYRLLDENPHETIQVLFTHGS